MLLIDVSYEKEHYLFSIKIIRIKPKTNVNKNELCTYKVYLIKNTKPNEEIFLNLKFDYVFGDSLKLCNYVIDELLKKENFNINDFIIFDDIRFKNNSNLIFDININRETTLHLFSINNKKVINNDVFFNLFVKKLNNETVNINKKILCDLDLNYLTILKKSLNFFLNKKAD